MRYQIQLAAGIPVKQFFRGRGLSIVSTGAAAAVGVKVFRTDVQDVEDFGDCDRNFSIYYPDGGEFTGAEFVSTIDTTLEVIVSRARVTITDGQNLTATIAAAQLPLPVQTSRGGEPATPLYVSGLTLDETPAASNANAAPVAVGPAAALVAAAAANVLERRFTNIGSQAFALGAVGLTWAQRCVVLNPGDTWIEAKGAALAWYAITDAGGASSCAVQELRS